MASHSASMARPQDEGSALSTFEDENAASGGEGRRPEGHLWIAELGPLAGDDEVAPGHEREPVAEAVPVHGRDHGFEDLPAALEGVHRGLLPERSAERAHRPFAVREVGADTKG